ncbi:hypothetical protein KAR91_12980 [Candidatus Pacearchaeota archaeon]|nr:hypothetical protein [Candidatus Pacearchaeota archaeon]
MIQLPLFSDRSYDYTILLNEVFWRLKFLYNPRGSQWVISIEFDSTEEKLIDSIPLAAGVDILFQYRPVGNKFGKLLLWDEENNTNEMNFDNVDLFSLYYFLPDEEIPERFDLVTPVVIEREAIITKVTFPGWSPP